MTATVYMLYSQLGPITNSAQEAQPTRPLDNTNSAQWSTSSAHQLGPIISQLGPVIICLNCLNSGECFLHDQQQHFDDILGGVLEES